MSAKVKKPSHLADRLKSDTEAQNEAHEEKVHYVDKIIGNNPVSKDINNDTVIDIKKDTEIDIKNNINNDTENDTENDTKNNIIIDTEKDTNFNTKNDIKNDIKIDTKIVIKKGVKKDIKKPKSGFHCRLYDDYILAIDELKKVTGNYKDDLAQEAFELLFKKYGVYIQHINGD